MDFLETDTGSHLCSILLDLRAAFDTAEHEALISGLEHRVGIKALDCFRSHMQNQAFSVQVGHSENSSTLLSYGVPQGSILGSLLFYFHLLPL